MRNNVRRDDDGFEDIDEFWAQDADDDTIDEEDDECTYCSALCSTLIKL